MLEKELVTNVPMLFLFCPAAIKAGSGRCRLSGPSAAGNHAVSFSVLLKQVGVDDRRASILATDASSFKRKRKQKISPSTYCLLLLSPRSQECMRGYTMNTAVYKVRWDSGQGSICRKLDAHKAGALLEGWRGGFSKLSFLREMIERLYRLSFTHSIDSTIHCFKWFPALWPFPQRDNDPVLKPQVLTAAVTLSYNCYQPV